ncbi:T9SS type A sorting domain-containing protein [Hymenobacter sp. BT730]|uniref:T9SS type A sorting domain-containing protein n=1 Tax=Hymenobacter sp. BT730 TaxID=3063332 RepID=UPI0026E04538|nr:T9SS type A sorting domain-containing protein [Hymenobacter sp. BT730]
MKHLYALVHRFAYAIGCLALYLAAGPVQAQRLDYSSRGFSAFAGTYTDLGTTGTVITIPADATNSTAQEIGFTFHFNGQDFTQFVFNSNGFLRLGNEGAKTVDFEYEADLTHSAITTADPADANLIAPFLITLTGSSTQTPEYRVATTGTAPNRVCTIQWENVADLGVKKPRQFAAMSFQVKLYETSNTIEFVYDKITPTTNTATPIGAAVGIKGSKAAENQVVVLSKASTVAWAAPTKVANLPYSDAFATRRTVLPTAGLTYRFKATPLLDATVSNVYTLGQMPLTGAAPHKVKARILNTGINALSGVKVTLTVTGAVEFTSTRTIDLPQYEGAIVEFDGYTPLLNGTNQVTVSLSSDNDETNNSLTVTQEVNPSLLSYADNKPILASTRRAGERLTLVRHSLLQPMAVQAVRVLIANNTYCKGQTVYGVVTDAAGTIIGRSPNYRIQAEDLSQELTFRLYSPIKMEANTNYYLGLAQTLITGGEYDTYEAVAEQAESPTRPDSAYFRAPLAGGMPHSVMVSRFVISAQLTDVPTCLAPLQLAASDIKATGATLTFTPVAGATTYAVEYGPQGFMPGTGKGTIVNNVVASPYQLTGLTAGTLYDVYVRTACSETSTSGFVGPVTVQTECGPVVAAAIPYTFNFSNVMVGTLPCGVTVFNANPDQDEYKYTWVVATDPGFDYQKVMRADYGGAGPSDDWFFTAPLQLNAGSRYLVSFDYRGEFPGLPTALAVTYGSAATVEGQDKALWSNTEIATSEYVPAEGVALIEPTTTGSYYVGFHAISETGHGYLYVKNVQVVAADVTPASSALSRSISAYPNPTADQLLLEVRGANAKGTLQVEIVNMLGQRVYASSARDNFINRLDVSKLASGRYILKVQSADGYAVRAIQVQH